MNIFKNTYFEEYLQTTASAGVHTVLKLSIQDFVGKWNQICSFQRIRPYLLKKSLMETRKLYIKRNNKKVDSIETGRIVIAHLLP